MVAIEIITVFCLVLVLWAVIIYIVEDKSENDRRMLMIIPAIWVFVVTIQSFLSVTSLHEKIDKLESKEPRYEEVTETFYREIK